MKLHRGRTVWLTSVSAGCLVFSILACGGGKEGARDKKEVPAVRDRPPKGAMSAAELNALDAFVTDYLHSNNAHTPKRDGTTCSKCVEVEIEAVGLTRDIDETTPPANARIVARMLNNDPHGQMAKMYSIKPKDQAEYYIWVTNGGKTSNTTVVEITKQKDGSGQVAYNYEGSLQNCNDSFSSSESDANFYSCKSAHATPPTVNKSSVIGDFWFALLNRVVRRVSQPGDTTSRGEDPAWIRCLNGCCTVGAS